MIELVLHLLMFHTKLYSNGGMARRHPDQLHLVGGPIPVIALFYDNKNPKKHSVTDQRGPGKTIDAGVQHRTDIRTGYGAAISQCRHIGE